MRSSNVVKSRIILLVMIICLVLLSIGIVSIKNIKKKNEPVEKGKPLIDTTTDGILNLSGFGIFFDKYTGNLKSSDIGSALEKVTVEYLPNMYNEVKNYTEQQLQEYYSQNNLALKIRYGKENYEQFSSFISNLKEKRKDLNNWDRLDILEDTFKNVSDKNDYSYVQYEVTFQDKDKIKFSLYVSKKSLVTPTYIIDVIK